MIVLCLFSRGIAFGQADPIVLVCATDARDGAPLVDADVRIVSPETTFTGITGRAGCVYMSGAFPVNNEEAPGDVGALQLGAAYPNPAGARVNVPVLTADPAGVSFALFDVLGRRLSVDTAPTFAGAGVTFEADVSGLGEGLYLYQVSDASGAVAHGKFVKGQSGLSVSGGVALSSGAQPIPRLQQADSVTVEIEKDGFVSLTDRRMLSRFDQLDYSVYKATSDLIPLMDMQGVKYLGQYGGGLYPDETNEMPAAHLTAGLSRAASIEPLDVNGNPAANGHIVMTSIGMSTTSSMFCGVADASESCKEGTFIRTLTTESGLHPRLRVVDGADPGKTTEKWELPEDKTYDRVRDEELVPFGLSEAQIQVAWVNLASASPTVSLPNTDADAALMEQQYGNVLRAMQTRYPNLKLVFFSSRVYGGYATTSPINPEPYAYESGFAVKWVIEAQLNQMHGPAGQIDVEAGNLDFNAVAPWISWGEYLWADGPNPRSDGLVWLPDDLKDDGTHLQRVGIEKVTGILLDFFRTSRLTRCWFVENGGACE